MSSTSLNDTISAIHSTFARPEVPQPLPDDLLRTLSNYAAKPKKSEGDGLQDELRAVFRNTVQPHSEKLTSFMAVLKVLRPAIIKEEHLVEWFQSAVEPFVDQPGSSRSAISDTQDFVLDALTYDDDAPDSRERARISIRLCAILLDAFVARTTFHAAQVPIHARDQAANQLQTILVAFARKRPRQFYDAIDKVLLNPETRLQALALLATFLEQQNAHLHLVVHTPVVEHLLKCLMNDTATVVVSAALRCLIMLLPHIPATVASQLPRLFLIYSRCLCWEKFSASSTKAQKDLVTDDRVRQNSDSGDDMDSDDGADPTWPILRAVPDMPESSAPELLHYFTYLYGLYPLNFLNYVRKPRKYLKNIDFPGADAFDLDQAVIRSRTEQFQRVHFLHPSFFTTTIDEELSENRWLKAEPSEVIAECHGLYAGEHPSLKTLNSPPSSKLPALPNFLSLDVSLARAAAPGIHPESPILPSVKLDDSTFEATTTNTSSNDDLSYLQRELALLRNELTFERYLKQQHVAAIGQLKRNHVKAVTVEAETATLINANRGLQKKLGELNKFNEKMQKETQARRIHTKQSEEQLMAKIRALKSELANQETLQLRLEQATKDCDQLRQLLVESEARESSKQEQVETYEGRLKELDALRQHNSDLLQEVRSSRDQATVLASLQSEHTLTKEELQSTKFILQRREKELEQLRHAYEAKVQECEIRLEEALQSVPTDGEQQLPAATAHLQDQLADARVRLNQTKVAYTQLLDEYSILRDRHRDLSGASDVHDPIPMHHRQAEYMNQEGGVRSYSPASSRHAYYTDRGMEQSEMFAPHMGLGPTISPVSSLNQSYPPARPLHPDAYQQRVMNANPMSRNQGIYHNEHALHPAAAYGATRSNVGSEYSSPRISMAREGSQSVFSFGSEDSESIVSKSKSKPEVRVYGRGGAQNSKSKSKDKTDKGEKPRSNGIRGLKGLM